MAASTADRLRAAKALRRLARRFAWEGAKVALAVGVREGVRRLRAGPLIASVTAPRQVHVGESFAVEAEIEAPFPLVAAKAYHGGVWVPAKELGPGLRREVWWFRATEPGMRPVLLRLEDREGHVRTTTRWIWVRAEDATLPAPVRVKVQAGGTAAEAPTKDGVVDTAARSP